MLLGRTASGLYWMHRYIERAENIARIVDAGLRMALTRSDEAADEWRSVVASAGVREDFDALHDEFTAVTVADFLLRERANPSSVLSCIEAARSNARMVRTALTRDAWESVNEAWMALTGVLAAPLGESDLPPLLDHIKRETSLIRGAFHGTMLRNEIYNFCRIGTCIERADNTARILDVKYYVLLPSVSYVGTTIDNYQWESILRSVSAHRSYRWVYNEQYRPGPIADFLILNGRMPRSLQYCYRNIAENLDLLAADYGARHPCHVSADQTLDRLATLGIDAIMELGLHEFLTDFIVQNTKLGSQITEVYNFD